MSNYIKYYIYTALYAVAMMFCSGSILQTFMLESGFTENQVYLYNALIQGAQVLVMICAIFFSNKIKDTKKVVSYAILSLILLIVALFFVSANREGNFVISMAVLFSVSFAVYIVIGLQNVESYKLPYQVMDMENYGGAVSISTAISGVLTFLLSLLYTFVISKVEFFTAYNFFLIGSVLMLIAASITCLNMKDVENKQVIQSHSADSTGIFKNKNMYILLLPNFFRGITFGIVSLMTVIGFSKNLLDAQSSTYMNVALQVATLGGNLCYALLYKKFSSNKLLLISTFIMSAILPLSIVGDSSVTFIVGYFLVQFFLIIVNTAIPVVITEFVPYEQMGSFTAIRLAVYTLGSTVASLILSSLIQWMGYLWLLILAAILQVICGVAYYWVAKTCKLKEENNQENTLNKMSDINEEIITEG